ncbi:hypothetical protein [Lentibacillus sediminis]|uniref:hypothetical protein n=1 Tax=Lentibacillus sediminis TaxID=1940529 RepID=UPI001EFD14E1|nr:hypothetical protein [Lentibacillus sediminis]
MGDKLEEEKLISRKEVYLDLVLAVFLIGAITMFFDENNTNDHFGWLFLIAFLLIRSLYDFIECIKEGMKKLAFVSLVLVIVASYFLITRSIEYLT